MKNKISFIHCADIHLDAPFSNTGRETYSSERRKDLKKTFEKIIDTVSEYDVDFLVIAGDLYEHDYVARNTIRWVNDQFKRVADKPVIIVPGNHDPFVKNSWYRSYPWHRNVHILTTENPEFFDDGSGTYFYGIGFDTFHQENLPEQKSPVILPGRINICLFHGTLDMQFTENAYNPVDSDYLTDLGFDYYALGHFHGKSQALMSKGIVNPGSPEPLGFDEKGEHGIYLAELEKEDELKRECTFIPIQKRVYYDLNFNMDGIGNEGELNEKLTEFISSYNYKKNIIRINLKGRLSMDFRVDLKELEQYFKDKCFFIRFKDYTRPNYDLEELSAEKTITGIFVKKMKEKIKNADQEEKLILEKALYFGLEALIEGTVDIS